MPVFFPHMRIFIHVCVQKKSHSKIVGEIQKRAIQLGKYVNMNCLYTCCQLSIGWWLLYWRVQSIKKIQQFGFFRVSFYLSSNIILRVKCQLVSVFFLSVLCWFSHMLRHSICHKRDYHTQLFELNWMELLLLSLYIHYRFGWELFVIKNFVMIRKRDDKTIEYGGIN